MLQHTHNYHYQSTSYLERRKLLGSLIRESSTMHGLGTLCSIYRIQGDILETCLSKEREAQESIGICKPSGHALATSLVDEKDFIP